MKPIIFQPVRKKFLHAFKIMLLRAILTAMAVTGIFGFTRGPLVTGNKELPASIASSFSAKYANARVKKWKQRDSEYLVNFTMDKKKCLAFYTCGGEWIKTEISLPLSKDLPLPVRESLLNDGYGSYYIDAIKEIVSAGQPVYLLHIDDGPSLDADHYDAFKKDYKLSFAQNGVLKDKQIQK
ncbi:MAG TPA: hypothetical protein VK541_01835 [Pedobacter sp.]|uniref:hypothetical protein n=1 Tax=Pedobacter sp. TaxID=1411316 RepID=UPI002C25CC9D|nr:hypothetical protein [Pedobacter sp.]HMI01190.1 hypothetical protein [Pedobacter sp.]